MYSMFSEKGSKLVVLDGFKYRKGYKKAEVGQGWRCTNKLCSAKLFTDEAGEVLINTVGEHNHGPCENLHRQMLSNSVKLKAFDRLADPPSKLIMQELMTAPEDVSVRVHRNDVYRLRCNIMNARRSKQKSNPKCSNDVNMAHNDMNIEINKGLASVSAQQPGPSTFQAHVTSSPLPTNIPIAPVNVAHTPLASDNVKSVSSLDPSQLIPSPAPPTTMAPLHLPPSPLGPPVDTVNVPPPHLPPSSMAPAPPTLPTTNDTCITVQWNSYATNMSTAMPNLLEDEKFVDVTLACDGKYIKCHKIILGACSSYFEDLLLSASPGQHPIILMKDFEFWEIKAIVDFIYCGSVNIPQDKLPNILQVANKLQIKGLMGCKGSESKTDASDTDDLSSSSNTLKSTATSVRTTKRPNKEKLNPTKRKTSQNTLQTSNLPLLERPPTSASPEPHTKQPKLFHSHLQDNVTSSSSLTPDNGFSLLGSGPAVSTSFALPSESITIKEESSFMDPARLDDNRHSLFLPEPIEFLTLQHGIKHEPEEPPEVHDNRIEPLHILPGPSGSGQHFTS